MDKNLSKIENFFSENGNFLTEKNKQIADVKSDLYAYRKAGLGGQDFIFVYNLLNPEKLELQRIHECSRKFANSFFKMPKMFRLKVPNILSVFVSETGFSDDVINWAIEPTRSFIGGEFHSVILIDMQSKLIHCQGKSRIRIDNHSFEFKRIDPQNRSFYFAASIGKELFS